MGRWLRLRRAARNFTSRGSEYEPTYSFIPGRNTCQKMTKSKAEQLLAPIFPKKHVTALLKHFERMAEDFQRGDWEDCIAKGGKFVEATLKSLYVRAGQVLPAGKHFKVDSIINGLSGLPAAAADDTVRITIPRACRFVYE